MSVGPQPEYDVAILGGGLAGLLLARQLQRQVPGARVALFERTTAPSYKVGEATVEIFSDYLLRRQGLSTYLYQEHLPKNGLRFFFDTEGKDAPLDTMSELGTEYLPKIPSFQLDRERLEGDLRRMVKAEGIPFFEGFAVRDLELVDDPAGHHRFQAVRDAESFPVSARWVIDATGRAGLIARKKELHAPLPGHSMSAAWGRFRGVYDVDAHPNHEWRARVRYAPRHLSTNHFAYPGYWIWFIPLRNGLVSVGVVCEREKFPTEARTEAGFRAFLNQHRAVRELLERSEMLDFGSFKEISFSTKRFFSTDRWATVGDAGAFADPFYSPGRDFIAMENDFVTDLIRRDLESNSPSSWAPHLEAYERFMHQRFEQTMLLYRNQYRGLGSYNLMRIKLPFELAAYYNYAVRPYMLDRHLDLEWLARANELHAVIVKEFTEQEGLFEELAKSLSDRNLYFSRNTGEHRVGFDAVIPFALELGRPISDETFNDHRMQISGIAKKQTLRLLQRSPRRGAPVHSEA